MIENMCLLASDRIVTRSPLHGILGSTEVLKDLDLNSMASTLAGQIDSCGRTLLDIIDHLLDFATLKGQKIDRGAVSSAKIIVPGTPRHEGPRVHPTPRRRVGL